ncbi:MAG: efflux RND transporter periplasmic adaptor subunit [Polyangia bacterium]
MLAAVGVVAALLVVGIVPRVSHRHEVAADERRMDASNISVIVTHPTRGEASGASLPSSVQPLQETIVYAQTNGYVNKYKVDIGDTVTAGQVMATINTPEVDQQLNAALAALSQTKAMVAQAKAQQVFARTTKQRYGVLAPAGVVSKQELEDKNASFDVQTANVTAAEAAVQSAQATVRRYEEAKRFATVTAPFDGVVTSRTIENGQLVTTGLSTGQAMFKVAKVDVMRLFVNVPQLYAPGVKVGQVAKVSIREYPDRVFIGKVERTARELDSTTRTLRTEVHIDNKDGALISGMYAQVALETDRVQQPLLVPATALNVTAKGTRVATVANHQIHWKHVEVENDLGDRIAIASGLEPSDEVVVLPGEQIHEGLKVETRAPAPPTKK